MSHHDKTFRHDKMRRRREQVFPNRAAFARAMGESESKIGTWERGVHEPRASQIPKIARLLGLDLADLFEDEPNGQHDGSALA